MMAHSPLGASSSHRWMHCPPSVRLCEGFPDQGSSYAAEGTDAHTLCEYRLRLALGQAPPDPTPSLEYHSQEMADCAQDYADYIMECLAQVKESCTDPIVLIEQRLDFSRFVPDGFGTGDCLIVADNTLHVIDYKHGLGVLVEADNNPQMMLYALGALEMFDGIYVIETVSMTIFQPRKDNVSIFPMPKDALYQWAEETLKPVAVLAFEGGGDYCSGDWCGFCKAKHVCRARAEANLALAKYDFQQPPLLTDDELEAVLAQADALVFWVSDIKDYALQQAVSGKNWSGWKLVEGRSNRKYTDETAVTQVVQDAGFDPYDHKLLGITAMTTLLGKQKFQTLLSDLIVKPQGKPTLVPISDKRAPIHTAKHDFMEEI